ncbi:hypothetical protein D2Q93_01900 [Alicyclobacillaceae bacterium I2511]|nr:hypothetical protein D2Q93_01900 [Alicyclobacillaceae bacterium I2511]
MAKQRKKSSPSHGQKTSLERDKPAEAYDPIPNRKPQSDAKPAHLANESPTELAEFLSDDLRKQLGALKAAMVAEQVQQAQAALSMKTLGDKGLARNGSKRSEPAVGTNAQAEVSMNEEQSFAELFNPGDEDEASFADLLDTSSLDWQTFKDQEPAEKLRRHKS